MDKILIVITGIGDPHYNEKVNILNNNLKRIIDTNIHYKLKVLVSLYSVNNELNISNPNIKLKIIREQNYIGDFILKYVKPKKKYKYIILLLDDIELNDTFNLENIINMYNNTKFPTKYNILSPTLTCDSVYSHEYMRMNNTNISNVQGNEYISKKCEYFFYLMNNKSYNQYYKIFTDNSKYVKYMWGIDNILYKYNISTLLLKSFNVKHYYTHGPGAHANKCQKYMKKLLKNIKKLNLN
jgi:hypothetical protein